MPLGAISHDPRHVGGGIDGATHIDNQPRARDVLRGALKGSGPSERLEGLRRQGVLGLMLIPSKA